VARALASVRVSDALSSRSRTDSDQHVVEKVDHMPLVTVRPAARQAREPGTPPRSFVVLASAALAFGTGVAIWLLPAKAGGDQATPGQDARAGVTAPGLSTRSTAGQLPSRSLASSTGRPSGFVTFVDTIRDPLFALPEAPGADRVRWFTLGHLTAGREECVPIWGGRQTQDDNLIANRLGRLRAVGGDAGLAFGGPAGRELAAACIDLDRLVSAYRQAIGTFDATSIDFEIRDPADAETVLRRARAIATLQREAAAEGRPLTVSFTLPVTETGLAPNNQAMLRSTREAGVRIAAVNLLVTIGPAPDAEFARSRLGPIAAAVRAAQPQIAGSLGEPAAWRRIALTPVLSNSQDLTPLDARRLIAFAGRNRLAWLSLRGAAPTPTVARLLASETR
jgi:chitinase